MNQTNVQPKQGAEKFDQVGVAIANVEMIARAKAVKCENDEGGKALRAKGGGRDR